ncbi:uncharacterized protein LOC119323067 [Triticum dicoccoides]|uniref:uncharacterized protein LOC119323067 n=1 Tax=Triticum dicoccoides TaxID=85692 RepID=UPI0018912D7C|nr:uncharacterized protein LOC119323067 [Triticum dicoccoides]
MCLGSARLVAAEETLGARRRGIGSAGDKSDYPPAFSQLTGRGSGMGNSIAASSAPALLGDTHNPCFKWKVHNFSNLLQRGEVSVNSAPFFYSGYKWFLQLTPLTKSYSAKPCVALSLGITRGSLGLEPGSVMAVVFELSIYNHSDHVHWGSKATFNFDDEHINSKKECLIPLKELLVSTDFLADDCCVFGVDILKINALFPEKEEIAIQKAATIQSLFIQNDNFIKLTCSVTINNFLEMSMMKFVCSRFELDGQNWYFGVYPRGNQYSNNCLSLYLHLDGSEKLPHKYGKLVELTLSILDQKHGKHFIRKCPGLVVFAGKSHWGWSDFIPLETFMNPERGYLVESCCIIKAEITIFGSSDVCRLMA